ncbi:arylsulfotransferase family protein [Streptomyces sp. B6B3]|uniref:arylsulfotransferase family protein n=1 Tax=Streptomyces sp. B6B3 TaxID=3153570 RepID=UPI00325E4D91
MLTTTRTGREGDGFLLTTPLEGIVIRPTASGGYQLLEDEVTFHGAVIYDNDGEPVWIAEGDHMALAPLTFRGRPALSVYSGGAFVVLDSSYTRVASFAVAGHQTDMHDFATSPDGSRVLLLAYQHVTMDLSAHGGPAEAAVVGALLQEQDTATGRVTFEWNSFDHIPVTESELPLDRAEPLDYLHVNSLAYDRDGTILVSGRHTSTVYRIDRTSGGIVWRFGGRASDFAFADAADMPSFQHDARRLPDGRLSVFDNGNSRDPQHSRGAVWTLDEKRMTARLDEDLRPAEPVFGEAMGNNQETERGGRLVSYGSSSTMVEFRDGEPVFTGSFEQGTVTYRTLRADWKGMPATPPDMAWTDPDAAGRRTFHLSWNGATEVRHWRIEARVPRQGFVPLDTVRRTGFETTATVRCPGDATAYRVRALDRRGHVLGTREFTEADAPTLPG